MKTQLFLLLLSSCFTLFLHHKSITTGTVNLQNWTLDHKLPAFPWSQPKDPRPSHPSYAFGASRTKSDVFEKQESINHLGFCAQTKSVSLHNSQGSQNDSTNNILLYNYMILFREGSLSVNLEMKHEYSSKYDHRYIVVLEPDQIAMEAANFLFNKQPRESSLLSYQKGSLHAIRGPYMKLTGKSHMVMVGHGIRSCDGTVQMGGHSPEEIAKLVASMDLEDGRIRMISMVGCYLGKERQFAKHLLQMLKIFGVETELQLYTSAVSVTPTGEQLTVEKGVWRHRDKSKSIFSKLDLRGNLLSRQWGVTRGKVVPNYQGYSLYMSYLEWPTNPQMFVPAEFRRKYPYIDCLEGVTWSLFYEEHGRRRAPDFIPGKLVAVWLNNTLSPATTTVTLKHITTILDLVCEIRFNAIDDTNEDVYYVLNNYIYILHKGTLHTVLVGIFTNPNDNNKVQKFVSTFKVQKESYTLEELREGLEVSEFVAFCRQTFQLRQCERNCDLWGRYFMTAVFSASVRNFRTFSLFLVTTIACEVSHSQGLDNSICFAFVGDDYPMAARQPEPGIELSRRGFYGGTISDVGSNKKDTLKWLEEVVAKENSLYKRSMVLMSDVSHDQDTELDIFAKVKVLNSYVFSSFLEFFRGTEEGRKLNRGCVSPPNYDKKVES